MQEHYDYAIIGAGPCGLTLAYQLLQGGKKVLLIDRDDRVGGLAKSHYYGAHVFDTGPKRFHTDDTVVMDFIEKMTRGAILRIPRSTKVHFSGRYFEWPLQTRDIFQMPFSISLKCAADLLKKRSSRDAASFHDYIRVKYGETLYGLFFKPYTQKFLRWDPDDIHADWASTGINRTVIDKRIQSNTLMDLCKTLLLPEKIKTEFLYPSEKGFGGFYDKLLSRCQEYEHFTLLLKDSPADIEPRKDNLMIQTKSGKCLACQDLVWSGNLNDLCQIIRSEERLHYLNTIFYNIICRQEGIGAQKAQWIYVSKGESLISRITCMKEFASYTCPDGYYNVICELTDSQNAPVYFHNPRQYGDVILQELASMGFLKDLKCVEAVQINPVVDTYPIYHRRYKKDFAAAFRDIKRFSPHIHLAGRSGAFWYNNSDHSIRFAIESAKKFLTRQEQDFDYRQYFGGEAGISQGKKQKDTETYDKGEEPNG
ncbi:MAG: FAD-dependent oxidoreductase [Candidatus Omnitrophota bacterium]